MSVQLHCSRKISQEVGVVVVVVVVGVVVVAVGVATATAEVIPGGTGEGDWKVGICLHT